MIAFRSATFAAALILAAVPAFAQDSQDHAAHHPGGAAAPQAGMTGCDMAEQDAGKSAGMMAGRGMMSMMNMMGAGHIEGRLAFVKTELKIGDGQTAEWTAFADAVRANFKSMTDMRQSMMSGQSTATTLPQRLSLEDKAVTAHLAGMKKVEESLGKLYTVLSEDQKKIADGIVFGPMGLPMGMM